MSVFSKVFKRSSRTSGKKLAVSAVMFIAVMTTGVVGISGLSNSQVDAGDCSGNSIIKCGVNSRSDFINDIKRSSELQHIYAHFGLTSADYSRFISSAKSGTTYRSNNTIVVDGKVVATNVGSIGRWASYQGSGYRTFVIAGAGTYYGNLNSHSLAASSPSLPVQVLFDSQGKMQFAVMMSSCANPIYSTPTTPPVCKELNSKSLGNNKYEFTTTITPGTNNETVNKVVYNFGDGSTVTSTSAPYTVSHTFTKSAKVTATVYVNVPGGGVAVSSECSKQITFTPPPAVYACNLLTLTPGKIEDNGSQTYTLAAVANASNATIKTYNFTFGDGKSGVVPSSATTASTTHLYAPGTYTANVSVTVLTNTGKTDTVTSANCTKQIVVKPVVVSLVCDSLTPTKGSVNTTTGATVYTFAAKATTSHATISSYVFNFGDNTNQTVTTSALTATSQAHTYVPGTYTATVTVNGKDVNGNNLSNTNANCKVTITVPTPTPSTPGVTITKHVDNVKTEQVAVGQVFTYELVVTNTGNVDLVNAVVTDTPPTGVVLLTADKGTISNNSWTYIIPSLKVGASASFNLTAKVPAQVDGNLVNTACVNAVEVNPSQPNQNDVCDTATVTLTPPAPKNPNITITKTVDGQKSEQVAVGQSFVYQLVIKNTGEKDLTNAVVTDAAPAGVTLLSADLGTVTSPTGWTYTIPSLAIGQSVTVNITAKVASYVPGSLVNNACVNAPEVNPEQPNQNDACDTATVTVTPPVVTPPTPTPPAVLGATAPNVLPNTGAGDVVGIFGATVVIAAIAHRLFLSRKLSRN